MENLIKLRKERNLTTRQIAEILKISKSTYNNWEKSVSQPDIENLIKLSDFFCVSVDYLLGNTQAPEKKNAIKKISSEDFTPEEIEMIKGIRELNFTDQNALKVVINSFLSKNSTTKEKIKK